MPNTGRTGRRELSVIHDCAATTCTYNDNHLCGAGEIDVTATERGPICATFTPDASREGRAG